ncbi:Oligopeptide ABC transporter, permease protein [Sulfitobacter noctilucicola]|uniref:Peptide/nickel transport system permease protein n=1 Tax=Sulfitobacter noctilucicola TaxID=1342301 RepID=A0A7W6Q2N4_9RHOB|nr:ABC transporter permease [Sulfitobacter noctilucicola]KIN62734.1 Oligopeptide ABC transporter, permease protein [Sulfitobacter noctilucicola]MBB4172733.1 peptide/nickel transport system permease protein [Sulfitobacter noctilucicola]
MAAVDQSPFRQTLGRVFSNTSVLIGGGLALVIVLIGLLAPFLDTRDPSGISPSNRNKPPGFETTIRDYDTGQKIPVTYRMGSDTLGRDIYSRVVYGARTSLIVGVSVAGIAIIMGTLIGLIAGYFRWADGIIMRIMDGMMAIPAILLAIAVVSLFSAGLLSVIIAIVVSEIPRVVRLVRSVVLSIREEPYVEAAITAGTPTPTLLIRHVLPNTLAPLIVQGTFIVASAIIVEAILSFLGIGIPPDIPTWGNIMAEGRQVFQLHPHNILYPGIILGLTVLSVNILGDGLRDTMDPRFSKRV